MAIYRSGGLAAGLSGALGGVVFVEARGSKVVRHRPTTVRKIQRARAPATSEPAAALQAAINGWFALSDEVRQAWKTEASNVTFPNRLGQRRSISGYQLYLKVNILRAYATIAVMTAAPGTDRPTTITSLVVDASVADGLDITLNPNNPFGGVPIIIYGSVRWSGVVTAYFRDFHWLGLTTLVTGVASDITAIWTPVFGALRLGQHIAVRCVPWDLLSYPSTPFTTSTTVVA